MLPQETEYLSALALFAYKLNMTRKRHLFKMYLQKKRFIFWQIQAEDEYNGL